MSETGSSALCDYRSRICDGRKVITDGGPTSEITAHPYFSGVVDAIETYFRLQTTAPTLHMVTDGSKRKIPISLSIPRTKADLQRKRLSYKDIADASFGMLRRTPDYMNAVIMSINVHASVLGQGKHTDFSENIRAYYEHCAERNLFIAHASINPQIDRARPLSENGNAFCGVRIVRSDPHGIFVTGAKMIATLAPIADEILIFNMPGLQQKDKDFAVAFAIPVATPGLTVFCRKTLTNAQFSRSDKPLANLFDEIDAYLLFEEVFVPWKRVFVCSDIQKSNLFFGGSFARHHSGHQGIVRGLAKAELLTGVAVKLASMLGLDGFLGVQEQIGELTTFLEITRGLILLSESDAVINGYGVMTPSIHAIQAVRYNFPRMYEKMVKVIQSLAAGSMLSIPSFRNFSEHGNDPLMTALSGAGVDAKTRVRLLNLAWDITGDGFGQRQLVYEYNHAGDLTRIASGHFLNYDHTTLLDSVERALSQCPS